jgi:Tol biopolymer transport system component
MILPRLILRTGFALTLLCTILIVGAKAIGHAAHGEVIVFWQYRLETYNYAAYMMDLSRRIVVPFMDNVNSLDPAFSPNGQWFAFTTRGEGYTLSVMNLHTGEIRDILENLYPMIHLSFSPNSDMLVYVTTDDFLIHIVDLNGNQQRTILFKNETESEPIWSPDGTRLAFTAAFANGDSEIFLMNFDGSEAHNVSNDTVTDEHSPSWSPDGRYLAYYAVYPQSGGLIHILDFTTGNRAEIPFRDVVAGSQRWSPDSSQLVFVVRSSSGDVELYLTNASGSYQTYLVNSSDHSANPVWSPDGRSLLFGSVPVSATQIYSLSLEDGNVHCVTCDLVESAILPAFLP